MKKQLKIILIIALIVVLVFIGILVFNVVLNKPKKLENMNFEFELSNIIDEMYVIEDDMGNYINNSPQLQYEHFLDDKVGIYNISVTGDGNNTMIKYTIKNHSKETINEFDYELALIDGNYIEVDYLKLRSQKISALATYDVEIKIVGNVIGVYKILPRYPNQSVGCIGGISNEIV